MFLVNSSGRDFFIRESLLYLECKEQQRREKSFPGGGSRLTFVYAGKEKTKKTKKKCITSHVRENNINERKS